MASKNKKVTIPNRPHHIDVNGTKRVAERVMVVGPTGKKRFEWRVK